MTPFQRDKLLEIAAECARNGTVLESSLLGAPA